MTLLLDLLLGLVLVLTALVGLKNGFFRELFSILGLALGILLAMRLTPLLVQRLPWPWLRGEPATAIGFFLIVLVSFFLLDLLGGLLAAVWEGKDLTLTSRLAGLGLGGLRGLLLVLVLAGAMVMLAPRGSETLARSQILPRLTFGVELGSALLPGEIRQELRHRWEAIPFGHATEGARWKVEV